MRKRSSSGPKRPRRDENQAAKDAVARLTESLEAGADEEELRRRAAAMLGSLGGKKGGPARAKALSAKRRTQIARKAAEARWKRED